MKTWDLSLRSGGKLYKLKADLVYESSQIHRINVYGKTRGIVLQNNYPTTKLSKGHKQIKWKLLEGVTSDAELLTAIIAELERLIKRDFPPEQLFFS